LAPRDCSRDRFRSSCSKSEGEREREREREEHFENNYHSSSLRRKRRRWPTLAAIRTAFFPPRYAPICHNAQRRLCKIRAAYLRTYRALRNRQLRNGIPMWIFPSAASMNSAYRFEEAEYYRFTRDYSPDCYHFRLEIRLPRLFADGLFSGNVC